MNLGMKTVDGIVAASRRMRLVLLLGPCLLFAGAGFAQTKLNPLNAMAPAQLQRAMFSSEKSLPAAKTAESKTAPAEAPAKGTHEGIQLHGYWTIDMRNPDGTVTAHREFENAIQSGGQTLLASALAGSSLPGGLAIALNGANLTFQPLTVPGTGGAHTFTVYVPNLSEAGPCGQLSYSFYEGATLATFNSGDASGSTCFISVGPPPGSTVESLPASWCNGPGTQPGCSTNLLVSSPYFNDSVSPLVLSGSMTVPASVSPGNINDVETIVTACDQNTTPFNCEQYWNLSSSVPGFHGWPVANANLVGVGVFTQKNLDSRNGDPAPVPYQPGQTIAVTVQISFQ